MTNIDYKKIAVQWKEYTIPAVKRRDFDIDLNNDFVWAIIGPRRAGKTYICFQIMNGLIQRGVPADNIVYINFEDEKILDAKAEDIQGILDAFYELYPPIAKNHLYLFLDEIQNVAQWPKWVRRINETKKNIKVVITGSSAKLLSKELATELRGRVLVREIFPLSLREYLDWSGEKYNLATIAHSEKKINIIKHFEKFLRNGGYPATVLNSSSLRDQILQQYFDTMLLNDVVERYNVKDVKKLRVLAGILFESTGRDFSFSKTAGRLGATGYKLSKNTVVKYVNYFEDAYLFFQNIRYEYSTTKQLGSIKKIYCVDNGLLNSVSFKFSNDYGRLLENAVYVELKRRGKIVYYYRAHAECDFIVREKNTVVAAIQVSYALTAENEQREIKGLLEAMDKFNLKTGSILTLEQRESRKQGNKEINIIPVWEWMIKK